MIVMTSERFKPWNTIFDQTSTGKNPIGCKWVYKIKYWFDHTLKLYKTGLVAKGFA